MYASSVLNVINDDSKQIFFLVFEIANEFQPKKNAAKTAWISFPTNLVLGSFLDNWWWQSEWVSTFLFLRF